MGMIVDEQRPHWSERAAQDVGFAPVPGMPRATAPARGRSGKTRLIVVGVAALVVVAAAVAVFFIINARNSDADERARAATRSQMTTYADSNAGIAFPYPTSWVQISTDEMSSGSPLYNTTIVAFGDPASPTTDGVPTTLMYVATGEGSYGSGDDARGALEAIESELEAYAPAGLSIVEGVSDVNASGVEGAQMTVAVRDGSQTYKMRYCCLQEGYSLYALIFGAYEQYWDDNERFFDATVEGFIGGT
jgi:PsbP-like protein